MHQHWTVFCDQVQLQYWPQVRRPAWLSVQVPSLQLRNAQKILRWNAFPCEHWQICCDDVHVYEFRAMIHINSWVRRRGGPMSRYQFVCDYRPYVYLHRKYNNWWTYVQNSRLRHCKGPPLMSKKKCTNLACPDLTGPTNERVSQSNCKCFCFTVFFFLPSYCVWRCCWQNVWWRLES